MFNLFDKIKPWNFFVFAAISFQILYTLVTPPLQAPDEQNHFYRAYQVANGGFLPERTTNRLGGQIPLCFNEFINPYFYAATNLKYVLYGHETQAANSVAFTDSVTEFKDFPNTAYYSAVSYMPQALGMYIVKQFNCSVSSIYYAGRFAGFLFWLIIMYLVIRIVPVYKWLFTTLILLPMNLYVTNSLSADTVTNCLGFLFIALVLKHVFSEKRIKLNDLLLLLALVLLIVFAKVVYVGLIVLLFLIPANKFKNKSHKYISILSIGAVSLLVILWWSGIIMQNYITYAAYDPAHNFYIGLNSCANYHLQKEYILSHGTYFFTVMYNSIFRHPEQFLMGYIGAFGQSDIAMRGIVYVLAYACLLFLALTESNAFKFSLRQKLIIFGSAALAFVLLLLSQHLLWDCVGEDIVDMVQGRYLIPLFPLLFILCSNSKIKLKYPAAIVVFVLVFVLNGYAARKIYYRFYVESFDKRIEFFCDFEKKDGNELFITTNPEVKIEGGKFQVTDTSYSGKHSAYIMPPSEFHLEYGFQYKFKNLNYGDVVEIEAWEKGTGAYLVISGKGKDCEDFFIPKGSFHPTSQNGWYKFYSIFTMTTKCKSSDVTFFIWNTSRNKIYIDDLKFSIKKYDKPYMN
ncbi:MAG: DUF2142 domain-containing protein [Bacteroidia bacterium]|nr:DUF2142 domain-containing protein [Bacteroidia bacterium]